MHSEEKTAFGRPEGKTMYVLINLSLCVYRSRLVDSVWSTAINPFGISSNKLRPNDDDSGLIVVVSRLRAIFTGQCLLILFVQTVLRKSIEGFISARQGVMKRLSRELFRWPSAHLYIYLFECKKSIRVLIENRRDRRENGNQNHYFNAF